MSRAFAVFFLVLSVAATAADKPKTGIAVYDQFPKRARAYLRAAYQEEIKSRTKWANQSKSAVSKAKGEQAKADAQTYADEMKQDLENLKKNDPPFVGMPIEALRGRPNTIGGFYQEEWAVGDFGVAKDSNLRVFQVIDNESAFMHQRDGLNGLHMVKVVGVNTEGWANDTQQTINKAVWVSGTTTYKTANGSTNTVLLVEPFNWDRYREWLKKHPEAFND